MENTNKIKRNEVIQIIFMILIAIAIACFIIAIIVILKNIEEIKSDPFEFGIKKTGIESCECFHKEGYNIHYPGGEVGRFNLNKVMENYTG